MMLTDGTCLLKFGLAERKTVLEMGILTKFVLSLGAVPPPCGDIHKPYNFMRMDYEMFQEEE